jgi:hypothetical protein
MAKATKPKTARLSENAKALLREVRDCDGAEVHEEWWPVAKELQRAGRITLGSARGPGRAWKRAVLA